MDPTPQSLCVPDSSDEKIIVLYEASHRSPHSNAPAKRGRGMKLTTLTQDERLRTRLARVLDLIGAAGRAAAPVVDLLVRLALAKAFFALGMFPGIGAADFPTAWPMIIVQVIGPMLMAIGLLVRPVALLMLVLTLRAQFSGAAQEEHLLWAALFGWYVVCGPASLSLDRLLSKGMKHSPLPLAELAIAVGDWVNRAIGPLYVLAIRLWLAAALAAPALPHAMLPAMQGGMLPSRLLIIGAVLLALGLCTPVVAAVLFVAGCGMAMAGSGHGMAIYEPLLLALLGASGAGRYSLDHLIGRWARRAVRLHPDMPHVVIVGAGFGGMACAAALCHEPVRVTLIDRENYHLFQPLLYQVATAALSPADITTPVRAAFRDKAWGLRNRWFADSSLEGGGFELPVPRGRPALNVLLDNFSPATDGPSSASGRGSRSVFPDPAESVPDALI